MMERGKCGERKRNSSWPRAATSSIKHGAGSVVAKAYGSGTRAFIDDFTDDCKNRMDGRGSPLKWNQMEQNPSDNMSSLSRTKTLNRSWGAFQDDEVEHLWLAKSVTGFKLDLSCTEETETRQQAGAEGGGLGELHQRTKSLPGGFFHHHIEYDDLVWPHICLFGYLRMTSGTMCENCCLPHSSLYIDVNPLKLMLRLGTLMYPLFYFELNVP